MTGIDYTRLLMLAIRALHDRIFSTLVNITSDAELPYVGLCTVFPPTCGTREDGIIA
jgi:hypothetical protein